MAFQPHGYLPARVEIGRFLRPRPAANAIAIRVSNPESNTRWYSGSGLYRGVSIRGHDALHIPIWGGRIDPLWIDGTRAGLRLQVDVRNDNAIPDDADLAVELTAPDGKVGRHPLGQLRIAPGTSERVDASITPTPRSRGRPNRRSFIARVSSCSRTGGW